MRSLCSLLAVLMLCISFTACKNEKSDSNEQSIVETVSSDDMPIIITLEKDAFEPTQNETQFFSKVEINALAGQLSSSKNVDKLRLDIFDYAGVLMYSAQTAADEKWCFNNFGLLWGYNNILISAVDADGLVKAKTAIEVFNTNQNNVENMNLVSLDSDGDGLSDEYEIYTSFTNPYEKDSDGNRIEDGQEDFDGDGLLNSDEQVHQGSPFSCDTDGDLINDADEVLYNTYLYSSDTDTDGVNDYVECQYDLDALASDNSGDVIWYVDETKISDEMTVSLDIQLRAELAQTVSVNPIPETALLSQILEGTIIGNGISLSSQEQFECARLSVEVKDGHADGYALYYFNPNSLMLERVPEQQYSEGVITASLEHFSDYVVLQEPQDDYIGLAMQFNQHLEQEEQTDSDGDGFIDDEDASPYSAVSFKTYEDYLRYFYPGKDVVTVYVDYPAEYGEDKIIDNLEHGHSWISYTTSDGETEFAGVYADPNVNMSDLLFNQTVPAQVRTSENWYYSTDPSTKYEYDGQNFASEKAESRMMIPFVVDRSCREKFYEHVNNYQKDYKLYDNNCTTFVMDCLESMGVEHSFDEYKYDTQDKGILNSFLFAVMKDSNSPGHAAYNASVYYDKVAVHHVIESDKNIAYSSKIATDTATMENTEQINKEIYFQSTDKIKWNGHTYQIIDISMSWTDAKAYCESLGGHLVTITSEEEQNAIEVLMTQGAKKQYWIGLDTQTGWVTGEAVTYSNWDRGEPNSCNRRGRTERYVHILNVANPAVYGSARLRWNDMFNDNTFPNEEDNFSLYKVGIFCEWDS